MDDSTSRWLSDRLPVWRDVAQRLEEVERGRAAPPEDILVLVRAYPEVARDLAIARREAPRGALSRRLDLMYLALHRSLFRPPARLRAELIALFTTDAAQIMRSLRWPTLWVAALFFGSAFAGAWLIGRYPELVGLFASEAMIERVQAGELWTDGLLNVVPSSLLSVQILTNNIMVSLLALVVGVFYGLGTIYIIGLNGMMLGAVFGYTAQYGLAGRLFEFVAAHGFVELSVIMIAGAAGVSLGEALARPGRETRVRAFQRATMSAARLMLVCCVFLVGAGIIEGYVSPNPAYPLAARLFVGLAYFALFVVVLSGALGRLSRPQRLRGADDAGARA